MKYAWLMFFLGITFILPAQQPAKINDLEKQRKTILIEIEETNNLLDNNKLTTKNTLNLLNLLIRKIESRKKLIHLLNEEIASLNENIKLKEKQINILEKNIQKKKDNYCSSVRKIYLHKRNQDNLLFILSAQNFSQSYHRVLYLKKYSDWQKKQASDIAENQKIIHQEKVKLLENRSEKLALLEERMSEENKLAKEEEVKKAEVNSLKRDQKKLQRELDKKKKQADALNLQIQKIIAEEINKSEKAAKAEGGKNRIADTKGGYAMTKEEKNLSSNFANNKGKLPFPLQGNYKVVNYFGTHQHKELSNVITFNNGIDIETTSGNEARAVFNGVVSRIFTLPGYNNSIIIRHGNYLTLYSYIEQVYVKQGDNVKTGQALGKIYTDVEKGNSTLLHFELWKEQAKLDPLPWIIK